MDELKKWFVYTVKSGYSWLKGTQPRVGWDVWVWNEINIPKHCFVCWMVRLDKSKTRDKLKHLGIVDRDTCPICEIAVETNEHLFFDCQFSAQCMQIWCARLGIVYSGKKLNLLIDWIRRRMKATRLQRRIICTCLAMLVYCIWENRNAAVWDGSIGKLEVVIRRCMEAVKVRVMHLVPKEMGDNDSGWIKRIGFI